MTVTCKEVLIQGSLVELTMNFYDPVTGALADPDSVTLTVIRADEVTEIFTPTKVSTGIYRKFYIVPTNVVHGRYYVRGEGTGASANAREGFFDVQESRFV